MIVYAVMHKDCRHVAAIHNDRKTAETVAANLWPRRSDWFVRSGEVDDATIASLLRGDKCHLCDQAQAIAYQTRHAELHERWDRRS